MQTLTRTGRLVTAVVLGVFVSAIIASQACAVAAGALLHPARTVSRYPAPPGCEERQFRGADIGLAGWVCRAEGKYRGTVVYLHGIADNRGSSRGVIHRFTSRGFDVIAYDSRDHGSSGGDVCTYGFLEKEDLREVVSTIGRGPVILIGTSLGAAVALQTAAIEPRISAIVAAEVFSDLRTIAAERAPALLPAFMITKVLRTAERRGGFEVESVSPMKAASTLRIPVLLVHGAEDRETRPDHSRRVLAALSGPKRLILVPGAGHNQSLSGAQVWSEIDEWIDEAVPAQLTTDVIGPLRPAARRWSSRD